MRSSLSITLVALVVAGCSAAVPASTQTRSAPVAEAAFAVSEPRELLPDEQVQQVLNRLTFGARPGDADKVRAMGIDKWMDLQLHPDRIGDGAGEALTAKYPVFAMKTSDIVHDYNLVQQLQRQVKKMDAGDSTANVKADQRDARAELLAKNPELAVAARKAQQLVGEVQSARLARAVTSDRQL